MGMVLDHVVALRGEVCRGFVAHLLTLLPTTSRHRLESVGKATWDIRQWIGQK